MKPPTSLVVTRTPSFCSTLIRPLPRPRPRWASSTSSLHLHQHQHGHRQQLLNRRSYVSPSAPRFATASSPPHYSNNITEGSLSSIDSLASEVNHRLFEQKNGVPPSEQEVLEALERCREYAVRRTKSGGGRSGVHSYAHTRAQSSSPTVALLSLDDEKSTPGGKGKGVNGKVSGVVKASNNGGNKGPPPQNTTTTDESEQISELAYQIVSHPTTFITPATLSSYVKLATLLRDPSPIPNIFTLYATKPIIPPTGSQKPIIPNPKQVKYAIPDDIASAALDAAIEAKDMELCLDIIETSYSAPAYYRSKLLRQALPAGVFGCALPVAIYAVAERLAGYQDEVDHSLAVKYAFAGLLAYTCFTGAIGMVALTTANDQMVRVTWVVGTPLRKRWFGEEERAALDRVAQAWGFEEVNKRGFEEGAEWELLREVVARKGMVLDNPTLMEGME